MAAVNWMLECSSGWATDPIVCAMARERMLKDWRPFFMAQQSERSLKTIVRQYEGSELCIGVPSDFYVVVKTRANIARLEGVDLRPLTLNTSWIVVLGEIKSRLTFYPYWFLALGQNYRVYVYSFTDDALWLVASDFDEFTRCGLMHCPYIYGTERAEPSLLVSNKSIWGELLKTYETREYPQPTQAVLRMAGIIREYHTQIIDLKSPYREEQQALMLLGSLSDFRRLWPFCAMTKQQFEDVKTYICHRMRCPWITIGACGFYESASGVFHATYVLTMDVTGAIFYMSTREGKLWRLCDNIRVLIHTGLSGVYSAGRRVSRDKKKHKCRLERFPILSLFTRNRPTAYHLCEEVAEMGESMYREQYDWISRDGRSLIPSHDETVAADQAERYVRGLEAGQKYVPMTKPVGSMDWYNIYKADEVSYEDETRFSCSSLVHSLPVVTERPVFYENRYPLTHQIPFIRESDMEIILGDDEPYYKMTEEEVLKRRDAALEYEPVDTHIPIPAVCPLPLYNRILTSDLGKPMRTALSYEEV